MPLLLRDLVEMEVKQSFADGDYTRYENAVRQLAMLDALDAALEMGPDDLLVFLRREAGVE